MGFPDPKRLGAGFSVKNRGHASATLLTPFKSDVVGKILL
jgi:hypothetical protein